MTDSRMEVIDQYEHRFVYEIDWENNNWHEELEKVNSIK